jgi:hypothetical protein
MPGLKGDRTVFYLLISLWAVVFVATVSINGWNLSEERFSFAAYLRKEPIYPLFSLEVVAVVSPLAIKKMHCRGAGPDTLLNQARWNGPANHWSCWVYYFELIFVKT